METGTIVVVLILLVVIAVSVIYKCIDSAHMKLTKSISLLYQSIIKINEEYNFNSNIPKKLKYEPCMKSKRSLDNLNLTQYITNEIQSNKNYFNNLISEIESNKTNYIKYLKAYNNAEIYTSEEQFKKENQKLKYATFNKCEKRLFKSNLIGEPITTISIDCHATYTSPSGRNHYWKDCEFSYDNLKSIIRQIEKNEQFLAVQQAEKEKLLEEKRQREKRLREVDKLEKQLKEKEQLIALKQEEFQKATEGHIYSAESEIKEEKQEILEDETPYQKLKKLKVQYENNEISREEYEAKRKELL